MLAGAGLQLLGGLFVKALDGSEFVPIDRARSPRRWQTLPMRAVAPPSRRHRAHREELGALGELLLAPLGLFILRHDVDIPAG
jgi:hypothetical protein